LASFAKELLASGPRWERSGFLAEALRLRRETFFEGLNLFVAATLHVVLPA
jgi:hypothetical protein